VNYISENVHRVLIKLSGEILAGEQGFGYNDARIDQLTDELIAAKKLGLRIFMGVSAI